MHCLVADGTYKGYLTAVFQAFTMKPMPEGIYIQAPEQIHMLTELQTVPMAADKADRVEQGIHKKMGEDSATLIRQAFALGSMDMGTALYEYIQLGMKVGRKVNDHLTHAAVWAVHKAAKRVGNESHMYLGVVRFAHTRSGLYYGAIEPENDVLELISPHFADRFPDQPCALHDKARGTISLMYEGRFQLQQVPSDFQSPESSDYEALVVELWRSFFSSITIESRKNPKLQKQNMPKKYWKHMPELQS